MKKRELHEFGHPFSPLPRTTVIFGRKCATLAFGAVGVETRTVAHFRPKTELAFESGENAIAKPP